MATRSSSVQRSFRLARQTAERLDAAAETSGETRNALADRLLREALTIEKHPLVRFQYGPARRREPGLAGTRLHVRDVIATVRAHENSVDAAATYLSLPCPIVAAAVAYYADHTEEIDADIAWAENAALAERDHWERQQAILA